MYSDIIGRHPYCWTSFNKMDQTWEAAKSLLQRYEGHSVPEWVGFLSSDLTNATNCQDRELSKSLLEGVLEGFGFSVTEYDREVLSLLSVDRELEFPDGTKVRSTNGIFMGEHLAKISLVTLGLCVEELAYREYCNIPFKNSDGIPTDIGLKGNVVENWWRYFHLGGDDHLAGGPSGYLDKITSTYLSCGSEISLNKHGKSRRCVRYCERIINLDQRIKDKSTQRANEPDPEKSFIVDSIKCRLLARDDNVANKAQDTNVAIGKGKAFSGCIKWLPKNEKLWPSGKVTLIRNLWVMRMGGNLPNRVIDPKLHSIVFLPTQLGGFDLNLDDPYKEPEESVEWLAKSPDVIKWIVNAVHCGWEMTPPIKNCIKRFNTAIAVRGTSSTAPYVEKAVNGIINHLPSRSNGTYITFNAAKTLAAEKYGEVKKELSAHEVNRLVKPLGYMSIDAYRKSIGRTNVFTDMATVGIKTFSTRSWRSTISELYDLALEEDLDMYGTSVRTPKEFKEVLYKMSETGYVRVNDPCTAIVRLSETNKNLLHPYASGGSLWDLPGNPIVPVRPNPLLKGLEPGKGFRQDLVSRSMYKLFGPKLYGLNRLNCYEMGSFSLQLGNFGRECMDHPSPSVPFTFYGTKQGWDSSPFLTPHLREAR